MRYNVDRHCVSKPNFFVSQLAALAALVWMSGFMAALQAAEGPGIPNITFSNAQLFNATGEVARIKAPNGYGHGKAAIYSGYLVVPCFNGGGGIIDVYSLGGLTNTRPTGNRTPLLRIDNDTDTNPSDSTINIFSPGLREAHTFASFWKDGRRYVVMQRSNGMEIWDMTNPDLMTRSSLKGKIEDNVLGNIGGNSDYNGIWWLAAQYPYVYLSQLNGKLHIVNVSNPLSPTLVKTLTNSALGHGSNRIASAHAIGNMLVILNNADSSNATGAEANGTYTFLNISDPLNPVVVRSYPNMPTPYASLVNGNHLVIGGKGKRVDTFDITDPANIVRKTPSGLVTNGPAGYVNCQDNFAFIGCESEVVKVKMFGDYAIVGRGTTSLGTNIDNNFTIPLGNLNFFSNDRTGTTDYSAIMAVSALPDTNGPDVNTVNPAADKTNVNVKGRIGLTFTDELKDESLSETTIMLRTVVGGVPTGAAIACHYTLQTSIVTLTPENQLSPGTTYQIDVVAGQVKDISGNGGAAFTSKFTTEGTSATAPTVALTPLVPTSSQVVNFSASVSGGTPPYTYAWSFGDSGVSSQASPTYTYASIGRYAVTLTVTDAAAKVSTSSQTQLIYSAPTASPARSSSQMVHNGLSGSVGRLYVVNPDTNSVTVINTDTNVKVTEVTVGRSPRAAALVGGEIWITNQDDYSVSILDRATNNLIGLPLALPRASQPQGIVSDGTKVYVALQATGQVIPITIAGRVIGTPVSVGPTPRALSLSGDGSRLFVRRFISTDTQAEIREFTLIPTLTLARTFILPIDVTSEDSESNGRGVPNYLVGVTITPDGKNAFIPAIKDNIRRGTLLSGVDLDFDNTVRPIVSHLNLVTNVEAGRIDFDNQDSPSAVAFNPRGDLLYIAFQGTNRIMVVNAYSVSQSIAVIDNTTEAPQALTLSPDGNKLYVHGFMGRSVEVYDVSALQNPNSPTGNVVTKLNEVTTVTTELLSPPVLAGKTVFYNASLKMSLDGYISCATCHLDGGHDGRVWDFTGRGEGLRRTTDLRGRSGVGHGPVHWTGNFDEIHDFEHDIRGPFQGLGFMTAADFTATSPSLGAAKAGKSIDLDNLAAYVSSLTQVPVSPFRNQDGSLTASAARGKDLFIAQNCASCHSGPRLTDSALNRFHDVGTITQPGSGKRLNSTLVGFDTPTLKGLWTTERYLHDGTQTNLLGTFQNDDPSPLLASHKSVLGLSSAEQNDLFAYLLQIDESETPAYQASGVENLIVVEAEAGTFFTPTGQNQSWIPVVASTFTNTGAIQALPNSGLSRTANIATTSPRADYRVQVASAGTYRVWVYGRGASASDNSVHVGVNNIAPTNINGASLPSTGVLGWVATPYTVNLTAGTQHISLWMREDGVVVDRLLLTTSTTYVPTGSGPIESKTTLSTPPSTNPGTLGFSSSTYSNIEGNSGSTVVTINVQRSGGNSGSASVSYQIAPGITNPATAGSDYTASNGTLNWVSGDATAKTFTVTIIGDNAIEPNETVTLTLSGATGASLGAPSTASLTITNDDSVNSLFVVEAEDAVGTTNGNPHTWTPVFNASYVAGEAIQALPNQGAQILTAITTTSPRADYVLTNMTGTYTIWLYGKGASTADNSVHIGINNTPPTNTTGVTVPSTGILGWAKSPYTITIPVGAQTLNMWMREDGVVIDRLLLTTDPAFIPTGTGPASTQQVMPESVGALDVTPQPDDNERSLAYERNASNYSASFVKEALGKFNKYVDHMGGN